MHRATLLLAVPLMACQASPEPPAPADLVVRGGSIVTVDEALPRAAALAARGDRIVAIGSDEEIAAYVGPATEIVDLAGGIAIPGFIDSHAHLLGVGLQRLQLDLRGATSWDEVVASCAEAAAQAGPGALVVGRGWHQDKFATTPADAVDGWPRHDTLSAATPNNPVVLEHASGHAAIANAAAMVAAGVDRNTANPEGGTIVRDERGEAIGVFVETAADLLPTADSIEVAKVVAIAQDEILANGITTFVDAGSTVATVESLRQLADSGGLRVRLAVMLRDSNEALAAALPRLRLVDHGGMLTVRAIKHWADGALGSRGAWLLAPYSDAPETSGLETTPLDVIRETAKIALAHNMQLNVHAIGDRANREVLDLFQAAFASVPDGGRERRWRIEHAQHLDPAEIPRFAAMGVIASMQGVHCTSDGPWVPERIGDERARTGAYVWRSLREHGAHIANGTDAPVEALSPIASYAATVTRLMANGERFYPDQVLTREEALATYTLEGAYATFAEADRGSLAVGKLADITVLDRDLLTVPEAELPQTQVVATIVGGKVVWRR